MIKLEVLNRNPLSLEPLIAEKMGYFKNNNVDVEIGIVTSFPPFDMSRVTANVGDITRIFERLATGEKLVVTSDLTRTMKLILKDNYDRNKTLKILAAQDQSLGIYTEYYCQQNGIDFEYFVPTDRSFDTRRELIKNGDVDGACMIDPFLIDFIGNGYQVAYEGKNHEHNYTCWAFHKEYYDNNPEAVANFHKSLNQASDYWNELSDDDKLTLANELLLVPSGLDNFYKQLTFNHDKPYTKAALETSYEWKKTKTPGLDNLNLEEVLITW